MRWPNGAPPQEIPIPAPEVRGRALGASNDGSVVVGYLETGMVPPARTAFRWTPGGGTQVLNVASSDEEARGVSRDGSTVIGSGFFGATRNGFVWTQAGGTRRLLSEDGVSWTDAHAVNHDGSIILGRSGPSSIPAVWRDNVLTSYTLPTGFISAVPLCLNDAGTVFGGHAALNDGITSDRAFIWTQARGMETLTSYMASFGLSFPRNYTPRELRGMSADGSTLVGSGASSDGQFGSFVVTIPAPNTLAAIATILCYSGVRRRGK